MKWNTEYGMPMHRNAAQETVSAAEALGIARHWLED